MGDIVEFSRYLQNFDQRQKDFKARFKLDESAKGLLIIELNIDGEIDISFQGATFAEMLGMLEFAKWHICNTANDEIRDSK